MGNDSKAASELKGQITRWANRMSAGLPKVTRRFVQEMVFGIQAAEDVKLSQVARSLDEPVAVLETEQRLSRQAGRRDVSPKLNERMAWYGSGQVKEETVLALDVGDVQKRYSQKMERLAWVRDGSTGKIGKGYWLLSVLGASVQGEGATPLYMTLYSQEAERWKSENAEMLRAVACVSAHTGGRGIWAMDRGGDRKAIYNPLLDKRLRWVIRVNGRTRKLTTCSGERRWASELGKTCPMSESQEVTVEVDGQRQKGTVAMGFRRVRLPWRKEWLYLVVIQGALPGQAEEPILLLTNVRVWRRKGSVKKILEIYLTRWRCEEGYRFVKQAYRLEDVRVRSYVAQRNIAALVGMVFQFVAVVLGQRLKLNILLMKVFEKAQRFYETARFKMYAIADGIYKFLVAYRERRAKSCPTDFPRQREFAFMTPPS